MQEDFIYNAGNTSVTRTLVRVGRHSYPINGIGSVFVKVPRRLLWFIAAAIAVALAIGNPDKAGVFAIAGVILFLIGMGQQAALIIRTASRDQSVLTAFRSSTLVPVKTAIEQAVTLRG